MFSFIFIAVLFFAAFLTPDGLVSTIVSGLVAFGVTHLIKKITCLQGAGAALTAFVVSFVVAIIAVLITTVASNADLSWSLIPSAALQVFGLATLAYKLLMADSPTTPAN